MGTPMASAVSVPVGNACNTIKFAKKQDLCRVFFSDSHGGMTVLREHSAMRIGGMGEAGASNLTLRDCPRDAHVLIGTIDLDERHRFRLCEIGLTPGAGLRVVQRGMFGGRVIAFGTERIALDGDTARAIHVRPAHDGANQAGASSMNDVAKGEKDVR